MVLMILLATSFLVLAQGFHYFRSNWIHRPLILKDSVTIFNPCLDNIFKYIFDDKEILIGFLNSVLGNSADNTITDVEYLQNNLVSEDTTSLLM